MFRTASSRPCCCRSMPISPSTRRASASTCATWPPRAASPRITINAHSTEVASCTFEEQRRVLDIAQDEIGGRLPLVNGIWADGSLEAARIARMAAEGGASALLVFPPAPFTLGQSPQMAHRALQAHRRRHRPAADRLPVSARDRPGLSEGYPAEACEEVPTIRAIKDWIGNVPHHEWHIRTLQSLPRPGQRALDPQRLAAVLARARLQRPAVGQRQRHSRPAVAAVPGGAAQRSRRGAAPSTTASSR